MTSALGSYHDVVDRDQIVRVLLRSDDKDRGLSPAGIGSIIGAVICQLIDRAVIRRRSAAASSMHEGSPCSAPLLVTDMWRP